MFRLGLWIDDERQPYKVFTEKVDFVLKASNYQEAIKLIESTREQCVNDKLYISFDHDLGLGKSGYDIAKYLVEHQIKIAGFTVHSMNPVGRKNIIQLLTHYNYQYIYN
jgi:hypothetical protein